MDYNELFRHSHHFSIPSLSYLYQIEPPEYCVPCSKPEPDVLKPNESFYVHIQNALQEHLPALVVNFRRKFNAKSMQQRHEKARKLHKELRAQRVERLSKRLATVARLTADCLAKRSSVVEALKQHIVRDMLEHRRRWKRHLVKRVEKLRAHNKQVKKRCEMLRYRNYLTRIALKHEEKRKRIGIF